MKLPRGGLILIPILLCWMTLQAAAGAVVPLQEQWRFQVEPTGHPERPDFDDSQWGLLHVPSNAREISDDHARSRRPVWYRNTFQLPGVPDGSQVTLMVEEAESLEAWVNGHRIGKIEPGSFALEAPITEQVQPGTNQVSLKAVFPGIRSGVWIHVLPAIHIEPNGLLVDTPGWHGGPVSVRTRIAVRNLSARQQKLDVELSVFDHQGEALAQGGLRDEIVNPGSSEFLEVLLPPISSPPLWSPSSPVLCSLTATLFIDGEAVQTTTSQFGFRWFRFDAERGFFFNGSPLKLRGVVYSKTTARQSG